MAEIGVLNIHFKKSDVRKIASDKKCFKDPLANIRRIGL